MSAFDFLGQVGLSLIVTDEQGLTIFVNQTFTELSGYCLADMRDKTPGEVLQGPLTEAVSINKIRENMSKRIPVTANITNYKKDGAPIIFQLTIQPIFDNGELAAFIGFQHNNDGLQRSLDAAQEMRHDVRNTLNYVSAMCQLGRITDPNVEHTVTEIIDILDKNRDNSYI